MVKVADLQNETAHSHQVTYGKLRGVVGGKQAPQMWPGVNRTQMRLRIWTLKSAWMYLCDRVASPTILPLQLFIPVWGNRSPLTLRSKTTTKQNFKWCYLVQILPKETLILFSLYSQCPSLTPRSKWELSPSRAQREKSGPPPGGNCYYAKTGVIL